MHHDIMFNIETKKAVVNSKKPHSMPTQGQSECEKVNPNYSKEAKGKGKKRNKAVANVCATRATAATTVASAAQL